jgi:hypothetical protein
MRSEQAALYCLVHCHLYPFALNTSLSQCIFLLHLPYVLSMEINPISATRCIQLSVYLVLSIKPLHVNNPSTAMLNEGTNYNTKI